MARELGQETSAYLNWDKKGSDPGYEVLHASYARLESVKARHLDPGAIATWLQSGRGDPPFTVEAPGVSRSEAQGSPSPRDVGDAAELARQKMQLELWAREVSLRVASGEDVPEQVKRAAQAWMRLEHAFVLEDEFIGPARIRTEILRI